MLHGRDKGTRRAKRKTAPSPPLGAAHKGAARHTVIAARTLPGGLAARAGPGLAPAAGLSLPPLPVALLPARGPAKPYLHPFCAPIFCGLLMLSHPRPGPTPRAGPRARMGAREGAAGGHLPPLPCRAAGATRPPRRGTGARAMGSRRVLLPAGLGAPYYTCKHAAARPPEAGARALRAAAPAPYEHLICGSVYWRGFTRCAAWSLTFWLLGLVVVLFPCATMLCGVKSRRGPWRRAADGLADRAGRRARVRGTLPLRPWNYRRDAPHGKDGGHVSRTACDARATAAACALLPHVTSALLGASLGVGACAHAQD